MILWWFFSSHIQEKIWEVNRCFEIIFYVNRMVSLVLDQPGFVSLNQRNEQGSKHFHRFIKSNMSIIYKGYSIIWARSWRECKLLYSRYIIFWGIFMNSSEKVGSERYNKAPLLYPWKRTLPRRCQGFSFQTQITELFILSTFFVFCNEHLNNHWVNFKQNSDKKLPTPPSAIFHTAIVDVLQRGLFCDGSTSSGRSCRATSYRASTMKDADIT